MLRTSLTVAVSTAAVTLIADVPAAVNVADAADGALPIKPTT
jgi:hypothetical protein